MKCTKSSFKVSPLFRTDMISFSLFWVKKPTFHFHWNVFLYYATNISIVLLVPEWLNASHVLYFYPSVWLPLFLVVNLICFTPFHLYSARCSPLKFLVSVISVISIICITFKITLNKEKKKNYKLWAMSKNTKEIVLFCGFLCQE